MLCAPDVLLHYAAASNAAGLFQHVPHCPLAVLSPNNSSTCCETTASAKGRSLRREGGDEWRMV